MNVEVNLKVICTLQAKEGMTHEDVQLQQVRSIVLKTLSLMFLLRLKIKFRTIISNPIKLNNDQVPALTYACRLLNDRMAVKRWCRE